MSTKIAATVVADSICNSNRITTMRATMPRFILAEFNTHRMLSKNSASSRAIPFEKMVEIVRTNPFVPIAWQKNHKGMQGTDYITDPRAIEIRNKQWLYAMDMACRGAWTLYNDYSNVDMQEGTPGITKQLCNRLLEPFMWHTVLVTATEWENFFHLRCPQYFYEPEGKYFRSRKDWRTYFATCFGDDSERTLSLTEIDWMKLNKGQAEIHMMALAEAMWDARNESTPKELQPGEWHIPYKEILNFKSEEFKQKLTPVFSALLEEMTGVANLPVEVPLSTAICAQTSYTVVGDGEKISPQEVLLDIHHSLLIRPHTNRKGVVFGEDDPKHMSPAEHCAQAMTKQELDNYVKGNLSQYQHASGDFYVGQDMKGWCHNLRGWRSYRSMIPNENRR